MPNLDILKPGMFTSFQDRGRMGFNYFAIPNSGFMDAKSANFALDILGLPKHAPLLECTGNAPHIQFDHATSIAITGAKMNWTVNGEKVDRNKIIAIQAGDILSGGFAIEGFRSYISIHGLFELKDIFGSQSTYANACIGGFKGRALQKGDQISWKPYTHNAIEKNGESPFIIHSKIPIHKGPEYKHLSVEARQLFVNSTYTIGPDSNRMGARLKGPKLESKIYQLNDSLPILPGFIQLPPSGQAIVILQDGQISGGYPRIAYIKKQFLFQLNQIPIGGTVNFEWV